MDFKEVEKMVSTRPSECGEYWIAKIKFGDYKNLSSMQRKRKQAMRSVWETMQDFMERYS